MTTNLTAVTSDGRYVAASIGNGGQPFPDDYDAAGWCENVCVTLGLQPGALTPVYFDDDKDPRTGDLLAKPDVPVEETPVVKSPITQYLEAVAAGTAPQQAAADALKG